MTFPSGYQKIADLMDGDVRELAAALAAACAPSVCCTVVPECGLVDAPAVGAARCAAKSRLSIMPLGERALSYTRFGEDDGV